MSHLSYVNRPVCNIGLNKSIDGLTSLLAKKRAKLEDLQSANSDENNHLGILFDTATRFEDSLNDKQRKTCEVESSFDKTQQDVDNLSSKFNWLSENRQMFEERRKIAKDDEKKELSNMCSDQEFIIRGVNSLVSVFLLRKGKDQQDNHQQECDLLERELYELDNSATDADLQDADVERETDDVQTMIEKLRAKISCTTEEVVQLNDQIEIVRHQISDH